MPKSGQLTPMLRHYLEVKAQHPDAVVLYRMGDFYEIFFEDAVRVAPLLEVVLTARQKGSESEAPMCGVPYHALEVYLGKLVRAGLKVAVCDQVEDPAQAKGLVRREVTRVITPGTVSAPDLLDSRQESYLAAVVWDHDRGGGALLDLSTGRLLLRRWASPDEAVDELSVLKPREALLGESLPGPVAAWLEQNVGCRTDLAGDRWVDRGRAGEMLARQFRTATLRGFGLDADEPAVVAGAAVLAYARDTQRSELDHVRQPEVGEARRDLLLDATTLANLEVLQNQRDGGRHGSLLGVLDLAITSPGSRLLARWLQRPLRDAERIEERLVAVGELLGDQARRGRLRQRLGRVGDPARLLGRAVLGALTPREAAVLGETLAAVPELVADLAAAGSTLLRQVAVVDLLPSLAAEIARLLGADPPATLREVGVIRSGVDAELDGLRSLSRDSKTHLLAIERRERERTGIGSLKVRYNRVFGYYLEVTKANLALVPEEYIRKQTLVNAERFITPELKDLEERILTAEERQLEIETRLFQGLRERIVGDAEGLSALAEALSILDTLLAFAEAAARYGFVRPRVTASADPIRIEEGRHPVVERFSVEAFVPNDCELDAATSQIVVLTGPNMGGKSTYLRQVALIVLMAQAGSFVPAKAASLGAVDRIFSRVGASDDLSRGESTFMVEMIETAKILHQATAQSLVILDEVGRGTTTFDGLSLAWAIVEHLHETSRPKTLFATHYHELTELAALLPRVVNRTMAVREWDEKIVFLRRVVPGAADKSYGVHVARLAGIPPAVVRRAQEVLANLEAQEYDLAGRPKLARGNSPGQGGADQLRLFAPPEEVVVSVLREVDLQRLSPLAALNLLQSLQARLRG